METEHILAEDYTYLNSASDISVPFSDFVPASFKSVMIDGNKIISSYGIIETSSPISMYAIPLDATS